MRVMIVEWLEFWLEFWACFCFQLAMWVSASYLTIQPLVFSSERLVVGANTCTGFLLHVCAYLVKLELASPVRFQFRISLKRTLHEDWETAREWHHFLKVFSQSDTVACRRKVPTVSSLSLSPCTPNSAFLFACWPAEPGPPPDAWQVTHRSSSCTEAMTCTDLSKSSSLVVPFQWHPSHAWLPRILRLTSLWLFIFPNIPFQTLPLWTPPAIVWGGMPTINPLFCTTVVMLPWQPILSSVILKGFESNTFA